MWFRKRDEIIIRRKASKADRRSERDALFLFSVKNRARTSRRSGGGGIPRWFVLLMGLAAATAVIWMVVSGLKLLGESLFSGNERYVLKELQVTSDGSLGEKHVLRYANLEMGRNLFEIDLEKVRSDLGSVPVVKSVVVNRELPGRLRVKLAERMAMARLGRDSSVFHLAVDRTGHVLGPSSRSPTLPTITGLRDTGLRPGGTISDQPLALTALELLDICDSTRLGDIVRISSIDVRHPEHLVIELDKGERVTFRRERLEWRLHKLAGILTEAFQQGKIVATADLNVDANFSVIYR